MWIAGEVLTASDLNTEFNNILNNGEDLWSPASKSIDLNGNELILDADADTSITADTDDQIDFKLGGFDAWVLKTVVSAVNLLTYTASATTVDLSLSASGSDTDISIDIVPKGAGTVKFGGDRVAMYQELRRWIKQGQEGLYVARAIDLRTQQIQSDGNRIIADRVFS